LEIHLIETPLLMWTKTAEFCALIVHWGWKGPSTMFLLMPRLPFMKILSSVGVARAPGGAPPSGALRVE
jgi:hypothetical protein